ncbi:hypothetical protein PP707_04915 [Acetobacter pasteurianus]|nr:hypothetical protein [Acetobacter pasteurianus]
MTKVFRNILDACQNRCLFEIIKNSSIRASSEGDGCVNVDETSTFIPFSGQNGLGLAIPRV